MLTSTEPVCGVVNCPAWACVLSECLHYASVWVINVSFCSCLPLLAWKPSRCGWDKRFEAGLAYMCEKSSLVDVPACILEPFQSGTSTQGLLKRWLISCLRWSHMPTALISNPVTWLVETLDSGQRWSRWRSLSPWHTCMWPKIHVVTWHLMGAPE